MRHRRFDAANSSSGTLSTRRASGRRRHGWRLAVPAAQRMPTDKPWRSSTGCTQSGRSSKAFWNWPKYGDLIDPKTGVFVDLEQVFKANYVSLHGSSIKKVAPLFGFTWRVNDPGGAISQTYLSKVHTSTDPDEVARAKEWLLTYNEDDNAAMAKIRDGMRTEANVTWTSKKGNAWVSARTHDFFNRLPAFGFHVNRVYFRIADADLIYVSDLQNRLYEVV
jgi:RNase_H superfamily